MPNEVFEIKVQINPKDDGHYQEQAGFVLNSADKTSQVDIVAYAVVDANIKYKKVIAFENNPYKTQQQELQFLIKERVNFTVQEIQLPDHYSISINPKDQLSNDHPIIITRDAVRKEKIDVNDLIIIGDNEQKIQIQLIEQTFQDIRTKPERLFFMLAGLGDDISQTVQVNPYDLEGFCEELEFEYDQSLFLLENIQYNIKSEKPNIQFTVKLIKPEVIEQNQFYLTLNCGDKSTELPVWISKI